LREGPLLFERDIGPLSPIGRTTRTTDRRASRRFRSDGFS
jgi:hypothetical protein